MVSKPQGDQATFPRDDYEDVQARFRELRLNGQIDADPSGWRSTYSNAEELVPEPTLVRGDLSQYHLDAVLGLASRRDAILRLLSVWENRTVVTDEVTLCPTGTAASLAVLNVLRNAGVRDIRFETPAFFASSEQAKSFGIAVHLIPTYRRDRFRTPFEDLKPAGDWLGRPHAIWLTQPRAGLGFDQSVNDVSDLLDSLDPRSQFVVVDEVTDQRFPSQLSELQARVARPNLFRIKSFMKGMGLNGLRLTAILHPPGCRRDFIEAIDTLGGSVDAYSLSVVAQLAEEPQRFRRMLEAANRQVCELRARAFRASQGSLAEVNHLENGYIGSMSVDLSDFGANGVLQRERLLKECVAARTPVVLGASYQMAIDPPNELIRLNFFMHPDSLLKGVENIARILRVP